MTENEFHKLSAAERAAASPRLLSSVGRTSREEARELLEIEGWTFVALHDPFSDDSDHDPEFDVSEVWSRVIGGATEWCELWCDAPFDELDEVPREQCWKRLTSSYDPRWIAD